EWQTQHEEIRTKIIGVLTNKPVLIIFDPQFPIELHTDASSIGYGAILLHRINSKPHVVEYYSRATSSCESRYTSYELETLAVVNAVKHFRHYLHGRKFVIFTDCNSIKSSRNKVDSRLAKWALKLQAISFKIVHRKGSQNIGPDALSRTYTENLSSLSVDKVVDTTSIHFKSAEYAE
ncbi:hypothetical protein KR215_000543, partial [Drosophila sulfurigaster]